MMMDFPEHGSRDPFLFVNYSNSYYNFVAKADKDFKINLNSESIKLLELFSKEINNSKRVEESIILKNLIENEQYSASDLVSYVKEHYGYTISEDTISSSVANINFEFIREKKGGQLLPAKDIYDIEVLSFDDGHFNVTAKFKSLLEHPSFKAYLLDSTNYSIYTFNQNFDSKKFFVGSRVVRNRGSKNL